MLLISVFLHAWWLILATRQWSQRIFLDIPFTAATKISDIIVVLRFLKASCVEILTIKIYDQDHKKSFIYILRSWAITEKKKVKLVFKFFKISTTNFQVGNLGESIFNAVTFTLSIKRLVNANLCKDLFPDVSEENWSDSFF